MLTRMVSDPLFPAEEHQQVACPHCSQAISVPAAPKKDEPVTWVVSQRHPLVPEMTVVRMFVVEDRGGVEVYSTSNDGTKGIRNFIPNSRVRLSEEVMPLDVFVSELAAAEDGDGDGDDPDDPDEPEATAPPPVDAQATT